MQAIDHAKKQIDEYIDPERGSINIGFPTSLANNLIPKVLSKFNKHYPEIKFHLQQGGHNHLIEHVKSRELDLAFLGPLPERNFDIHAETLFSEDLSVLVPHNHRIAKRKSVYLSELKNESFVLFPKGYVFNEMAITGCREAGFQPFVSSEGTDLDTIKGLVAAGTGITLLPDSALNDVNTMYTAKIVISSPQLHRTVGMITSKHRDLTPSEKVFYNFVLNMFQ